MSLTRFTPNVFATYSNSGIGSNGFPPPPFTGPSGNSDVVWVSPKRPGDQESLYEVYTYLDEREPREETFFVEVPWTAIPAGQERSGGFTGPHQTECGVEADPPSSPKGDRADWVAHNANTKSSTPQEPLRELAPPNLSHEADTSRVLSKESDAAELLTELEEMRAKLKRTRGQLEEATAQLEEMRAHGDSMSTKHNDTVQELQSLREELRSQLEKRDREREDAQRCYADSIKELTWEKDKAENAYQKLSQKAVDTERKYATLAVKSDAQAVQLKTYQNWHKEWSSNFKNPDEHTWASVATDAEREAIKVAFSSLSTMFEAGVQAKASTSVR